MKNLIDVSKYNVVLLSMPTGIPKSITELERFFLEPKNPKHRQYEALRAVFVEGRSPKDVAKNFGYTPGSLRVLCHHFRRDEAPRFFLPTQMGPRHQKKTRARNVVISMRKQNHSVYEISEALKEAEMGLSPTAVQEILRDDGFAALPRRLDEERPVTIGPEVQAVADVRSFSLAPRRFLTNCGGLFLFLPLLAHETAPAHTEPPAAPPLPGGPLDRHSWP